MRTMRHVDTSAATVADGPDAEGNEYYDTGKPTGLRTGAYTQQLGARTEAPSVLMRL